MRDQRGQVLAFMAVALSVVLFPVAAYAIDAATLGAAASRLQGATADAALDAAQQLDVGALRANGRLILDHAGARRSAIAALTSEEPMASIRSVSVDSTEVTISTDEDVALPFAFLAQPSIRIHARASARLTAGYDGPSSLLPLSTSNF